MDIIGAHRQGLIEQLDEEVAALAGRPADHAQRAIMLHHLFDHSRGNYQWALAEARRALRIAAGVAALRRRLDRWGWATFRRDRAEAALEHLADASGEAARLRAVSAYLAYRMTATQALREDVATRLDPVMVELLERCHVARRTGSALPLEEQLALADQAEALASGAVDHGELAAAWAAIGATSLGRAASRLLGDKALAKKAVRDRRRGATLVERDLRTDPALPISFRANPAQHFYALQHHLRQRRRQQWREACDLEPDAFELAA